MLGIGDFNKDKLAVLQGETAAAGAILKVKRDTGMIPRTQKIGDKI